MKNTMTAETKQLTINAYANAHEITVPNVGMRRMRAAEEMAKNTGNDWYVIGRTNTICDATKLKGQEHHDWLKFSPGGESETIDSIVGK